MRRVPGGRVYRHHGDERAHALAGEPLAPFRARAAAFAIDMAAVLALTILTGLPAAFRARAADPEGHLVVHFRPFHGVWGVALAVAYFGLATWLGRGRSPGKRLLGIRVVSLTHARPGLWQCVERALGYGASMLECGFGFAQYFLHHNRQTVHDRIAETVVLADRRPRNAPESSADQDA